MFTVFGDLGSGAQVHYVTQLCFLLSTRPWMTHLTSLCLFCNRIIIVDGED